MARKHNLIPLDELIARLEAMDRPALQALADRAGVHVNTVRYIRNGATENPGYRVVEALCEALAP